MKNYFLAAFGTFVLCCLFLTGCEKTVDNTVHTNETRYENNTPSEIFTGNETVIGTATGSQSDFPQTGANDDISEPREQEHTDIGTTTEPRNNAEPSESVSETDTPSTEEAPAEVNSPQWIETAVNGEFFVNTDDVYRDDRRYHVCGRNNDSE